MHTTISFKINLIVIIVVLLLGSVLGFFFIRSENQSLHEELNRRIQIVGDHLTEELIEQGMLTDEQAMGHALQIAVLDEEINYVIVKSLDGEVLASRWTAKQQQGGLHEYEFPLHRSAGNGSQSSEPFGPVAAEQKGKLIGHLSIGVDLQPIHRKMSLLISRTIAAIAVAIVLSLIAGYCLVRILLQHSLKPLLSGIESIGSGDLAKRITPEGSDELGKIGEAFNMMAARLSETLVSKEHLETAVEERTAELKAALDERSRAQADLVDREEHIRLLLDSAAEAIYGIDLDGRCTFCNPACVRILGYERQEDLINRNMHDLIHHSREDGTTYPVSECSIFSAYRTGEGNHSQNEVFWKADGTGIHVEYWSYPVRKNGAILGAVVTFLDITGRLRLEQQLQQAQKMEAIGLLAGGIAHDFNNILTAIFGFGSLLQRKIASDDPRRVHVDQTLLAAERAAQLTRSLLAFSRKQVMDMKQVRLNEIIGRQKEFLRRIIGEDIELKTILPRDPLVMADSGQIEQILMNLATNARDAMPGGGTLTIETDVVSITDAFVSAHGFGKPGVYALISVTDTGTGMDEETRRKIFDPFFTTKEVGRGTGLGMAIVYGIVKQHKGYINVYSQAGEGTTFRIYLPLLEQERAAPEAPVAETAVLSGTETILLAEDDSLLRAFFSDLLSEFGYTVLTAEDGQQAISMFSEHQNEIQLVVIDMIMPKVSGLEAYEAIRKIKPGIKVIFSSGYTASKVMHEGLPAGTEFIPKPAPPQDYLKRIRKVLDGR